MSNLFRAVGRIEGMLTQFLGFHEAQSKRIDTLEEKQDEHGSRIDALENFESKALGYATGAVLVLTAVGWGIEVFVRWVFK